MTQVPHKPPRMMAGYVTVNIPASYGPAQIWMGTGPSGVICAEGIALDYQGTPPQDIRGKILPLNTDPSPVPPADAIQGAVVGNNWCIKRGVGSHQDIPGAVPGTNTLAIWACYGGSPAFWEYTSLNFQGVANTDTDCGGSTSCPLEATSTPQLAGALVVDTAPMQWLALVTGLLGGAGAALNGRWLLTLRPQAELRCVWDNGGDGETTPHVALGHDGLKPREFVLTLRHGAQQLRYTRSVREWNWLGANLLYGAAEERPAALEVVPV